jgi:Asp-tRNA(Asn)/Glu-tRNA(Gln) amidotransferase A subunit family amidase
MGAIDRGKEIVKEAIRATQAGLVARIPVADEANLVVFERALRAPDVQRMLVQKGVRVEFFVPEAPVEQAKKSMLQVIRNASAEIREIVFPVIAQDYADAEIALASSEVQQALNRRGITASLLRESQEQIVITSIDQVISGELDRYLRERES